MKLRIKKKHFEFFEWFILGIAVGYIITTIAWIV